LPVPLAERLRELIRREGPITFHEWMKAALYDPLDGYYQRSGSERWGREGDYRTSPERSELFAATFARYFAKLFDELQRPEEWTIVECGAGNGGFAAGVLRALSSQFPQVFAATRYFVYELSDDARRRARETLVDFGERVQFASDLNFSVSTGIYFSNELFDAFPVHRVVNSHDGLSEFYVTIDSRDNFVWSAGPPSTERLVEFCRAHFIELAPGQVIEINLRIDDWLAQVAGKLKNGFLITVDYGAEAPELYDAAQRPNGSLRGFSRHDFVEDLLAKPGECDITASVNWTQVKKAGEQLGFKVVEFASQDKFLIQAGLLEEMERQLSTLATTAEKISLTTGAREMILPGGMASSFQVLVQRKEPGNV
jgi:SAM-dependent MidA family methyltransferase